MTDEKFYDLYKIEDEEEEEEEEETFEEQMLDRLGTRWEWESDAERKNACFSPAYKRFPENGCRGILTYEEAVEAYKFNTQVDPETVTSWPHLDWLKKHREERSELREFIRQAFNMSVEEYLSLYFPYEPMIKYMYGLFPDEGIIID